MYHEKLPKMAPTSGFAKLWGLDWTRDRLMTLLDKGGLQNARLVCPKFNAPAAQYLFSDIQISFRSSTFTKHASIAALERIGGHIQILTFKLSHTKETFLPLLLNPATGKELTFVYKPQVHLSCSPSKPKYGSWEITNLLVRQYPPLFHAATNMSSFLRAFTCMPNPRHVKVICNGQSNDQQYRRSIVDYGLISLRVALEQAPLQKLEALSLLPIHPDSLLYLRPVMGFGMSPVSRKRWTQI
jgi:hypothetical protein